VRPCAWPVALDGSSNTRSHWTDSRGQFGLNSTTNEGNLFLPRDVYRHIGEPPLDLQPFVANFASEAVCIIVESLVQNTNDKKATTTTRSSFRELLEEKNVGAPRGCMLQELPHFINDDHEACACRFLRCSY
jgi:hypothetical protein